LHCKQSFTTIEKSQNYGSTHPGQARQEGHVARSELLSELPHGLSDQQLSTNSREVEQVHRKVCLKILKKEVAWFPNCLCNV